jgi:hypothetical protein
MVFVVDFAMVFGVAFGTVLVAVAGRLSGLIVFFFGASKTLLAAGYAGVLEVAGLRAGCTMVFAVGFAFGFAIGFAMGSAAGFDKDFATVFGCVRADTCGTAGLLTALVAAIGCL